MKKKDNLLSIIQKFVNTFAQVRIEKEKIKESLSDEEIELLSKLKILKLTTEKPFKCRKCDSLEIDVREFDSYYLVKCKKCGVYKVGKTYFYDISYRELASQLVKLLGIKCEILDDRDFYVFGEFVWENLKFLLLIIPTKLEQDHLLEIFYENLQYNAYTLCIVRDSILPDALNILPFITFGNLIYVMPISQINDKDLINWLNKAVKIRMFEDRILQKIEDEELKRLIVSINTNPKYVLVLLSHLRTLKNLEGKSFSWMLLENLVSIIFRQLYSSDISFGGGRNKGERLPDNVFLVREKDGAPEVLGLVDCKSSYAANFDKELTEKYLAYIEKARKIDLLQKVNKALIFIVFDIKGRSALRFYSRLENHLRENEYVVILPIDSLALILDIYLNIIIQGELRLKDTADTFESMLTNLFTIEYLSQLKRKYPDTNNDILAYGKLFRINKEDILNELENIIGRNDSSVKRILETYREKEV